MDLIIHISEEDFKNLAYADHFKLWSYIESGEVVEENALEQEPCDDAISRQAVLNLAKFDGRYRPSHRSRPLRA